MSFINYVTQIQIDFGALKLLQAECERVGIRRPLIVTDAGVRAVGILDKALAALPGLKVSVFDQTPSNPTEGAVRAAVSVYQQNGCDGLIALGGGSSINAEIFTRGCPEDYDAWATEYGWSTHDNSTYTSPVPAWKKGVTPQQQADYLLSAQTYLTQFPQVEASFYYVARDKTQSDAQQANFGLSYTNGTPKPALKALKCATTGICGP